MSRPAPAPPYWRLSTFYFFYFGSLGALVPYWSLYLQEQGLAPARIGELIAVIAGTKLVAPYLWGWIADRTGRSMRIIRLASLAAMVSFCGVYVGSAYWWLVLVMLVFTFFWNAALPQFEANTLNHLGERVHRYSSIRLWGSIGFILTVAGTGPLLGIAGTRVLPTVILILFAGIWLSALAVPEREGAQRGTGHPPFGRSLWRWPVLALLAVVFFNQVGHGPYYAFFSLYLEQHGYSRSLIGQLWALGVIAEVGVFLLMPRWLPRLGAGTLLVLAMAATTLRWLVTAAVPDWPLAVAGAQLLHAASFGVVHAAAIHLVHSYFTGAHQGRGQALYSSASFGAGGAIGSLLSGHLWEAAGPAATYVGGALAAGVATVVALAAARAFNRAG